MAKKRILYIEDDAETRSLMADILHMKGYAFYGAGRALEGIRVAKEVRPDLVIIDLILPDMQGFEVTTLLKSMQETKDTPVIALTAETREDIKELTLAAGCDGFINKPINVNEFLLNVDQFLKGRRDKLSSEQQEVYLKKYTIQLVEKLSSKIIEMETANENLARLNKELTESKEELSQYNDRLFYLNNLANELRKTENPDLILSMLPAKTLEGFKLQRCVIFELGRNNGRLKPLYFAGIERKMLMGKKLFLGDGFLKRMREQGGLIWLHNYEEISENRLEDISQVFESTSFILSNLSDLSARSDATQILRSVSDGEQPAQPSKYIIYIDKGFEEESLATYEVRILKSFVQTVGTIYENMLLYHRLLETYKIKEQQAITDGLTGVYNYRHLMRELEREVNRVQRFNTVFSILMFDIDHFKNYNDKNGHQAGDQILKKIAKLVDDNTRRTDMVARYGGEEFVVLLPELTKKEASVIAEKLHKLVEQENFHKEQNQPGKRLTISMGVASFPCDAKDIEALMINVDKALYQAKNSGRNRVVIFNAENMDG